MSLPRWRQRTPLWWALVAVLLCRLKLSSSFAPAMPSVCKPRHGVSAACKVHAAPSTAPRATRRCCRTSARPTQLRPLLSSADYDASRAIPTPPPPPEPSAPAPPGGLEARVVAVFDTLTGMFPLWVLGAAVLGMCRPAAFDWFTPQYTTLALAFSMTCMGMTLSVDDFRAIAKQPRPVAIGTALQYSVMPCMGLLMSRLFGLPPALAAGVCLVGACPGGTASNLVALIAGADVALSVLLTAASTVLATALTPLITRTLVGGVVQVSARQLVASTAQVVFAPVALGLLLASKAQGFTRRVSPYTPFACVALVAAICGSVVAQNAGAVAASGLRLVCAVAAMHAGGFALGYGAGKASKLGERASRTVSIEVGMQNSALAVVLARSAFADPLTALPGAISATVHSVLGSVLAAFWRMRGVKNS